MSAATCGCGTFGSQSRISLRSSGLQRRDFPDALFRVQRVGWVESTGRANARPMIGSAKQSTLWRKIGSITVAVVQRSGIICVAESLFGILSTRRLTRAFELSLKTTSEHESYRTEVALRVLALASIGETSGVRATTRGAGPGPVWRRHALMLAATLATFAAAGQAQAACDPPTSSANPLINTTVNCTGTTKNQNGNTGYGVPEDDGITINVGSAGSSASVTGTDVGIEMGGIRNAEKINNFGTISGAAGILGHIGIVDNKVGATISGSAAAAGISFISEGVVINSGT